MAQKGVTIWEFADASDRDNTGTDQGLRVGDLGYIRGQSLFTAGTAGGAFSTWVSASTSAFDWKQSVRAATLIALPANTRTGNVLQSDSFGALPAIDGVTLVVGESVLILDEVIGANNGIFTVTAVGSGGADWILTRRADADHDTEVSNGLTVYIGEGTQGGRRAVLTVLDPFIVNTTAWVFDIQEMATQTLAVTLAEGNITGGTDIVLTIGDDIVPATTGNSEVGTAANRFALGHIDQFMVAGAIAANGSTGGDDIVVGHAAHTNPGLTFYGTTASVQSIVFTDQSGGFEGFFQYNHNDNAFIWATLNGTARLRLDDTTLRPETDALIDLGVDGTRWGTVFADILTAGGAVAADGASNSNDVVIGDGVGDRGATIFSGAASLGVLSFADATADARGVLAYNHSGTPQFELWIEAVHEMDLSAAALSPFADGGLDLGLTGTRWGTVFADNLTAAGGQVANGTTDTDDIVVGVGDGTNIGMTFYQGATGQSDINFANASGVLTGVFGYDQSNNRFEWRVENVHEMVLNANYLRPWADGGLDLGVDAERWGTVFAANLLAGGAVVADGQAEANDMVLGDGTTNAGLTLFASNSDWARIFATDVAGTFRGIMQYGFGDEEWSWYANAVGVMILDEVDLRPFTNELINLGSASVRWGGVFTDTLDAYGNVALRKDEANERTFGWYNEGVPMFRWHFQADERLEFRSLDSAGLNGLDIFSFTANVGGVSNITFLGSAGGMYLDAATLRPAVDAGLTLGNDTVRWSTVFADNLVADGAVVADGPAGMDSLVIGDGGAAYGITIFTGTGDQGNINFTDAAGTFVGSWGYDHNNVRHEWAVEGTNELILTATRLAPWTDAGLNLGIHTTRWGTVFSDNLTAGGGQVGDANGDADDLVLGDGTTGHGLTGFVGASGDFRINVANGTNKEHGGIRYLGTATPDAWIFRVENSDRVRLNTVALIPQGAAMSLGDATDTWSEVHGDVGLFGGAIETDGHSSGDEGVFGDGVGNRGITIFSGTGSIGRVVFADTASSEDGSWGYIHTTQNHFWKVNNSDRLSLFSGYLGPTTDNLIDLGIDAIRFGDAFLRGRLLARGGLEVDGHGSYNGIVVGNGSGEHGITIFGSTTGNLGIMFTDSSGDIRGLFTYNDNTPGFTWKIEDVNELVLNRTSLTPSTDAGLDLGIDGTRWATVFADRLTAGGAVVSDGVSGRDHLVLGDGVGDRGLTIFAGTGSSAWIVFTDTAATNNNGAFQYSMAGARFQIYVAGAHVASLHTDYFEPQTDGGMDLGTSGSGGWKYIFQQENGTAPTVTDGEGATWVRDDAPTTLMFRDDLGNDHPISLMETISVHGQDFYAPSSSGAVANSTNDRDMWQFVNAATSTLFAEFVAPRTYTGRGMRVTVAWSQNDTSSGSDVVWEVSIERLVVGANLASDSFDTATQVIATLPGVADQMAIDTFDIAIADMDALAAGERFRLRIQRLGNDGNDGYTGVAELYDVWLDENP